MKISDLNKMVDGILTEGVKDAILNESEPKYYHIMLNGESIEACESEDEAKDKLEVYQKQHPDQELLIEPSKSKNFHEMVDELDEMCDKMEDMNENKKPKKVSYQITEAQLRKVIDKTISEAVPGLSVTNKVKSANKKENTSHNKEVSAKMKKALSFDGNDNPEFPKQISKGDKVTKETSSEEQEYVDMNRGNNMLDLDYDSEPSKQFKDRQKKSLEGDSTTGNSQDAANVIKTDTGKNLAKIAADKEEYDEEMPMYKKDAQPVKIVKEGKKRHAYPESELPEGEDMEVEVDEEEVNETEENVMNESVKDEISKLKYLYTYNKKTQ